VSHGVEHLHLHIGILGQGGGYVIRTFVQNFTRCDGIPLGLARVSYLEHVDHELRDAVRAVALVVCPVAIVRDALQLE
jgi:hypothetical protein